MTYNPRAEAQALLPDGYVAAVLEPSPPASLDEAYWADDPTRPADLAEVAPGQMLVAPTSGGDISWDDLARSRFVDSPETRQFIAERWLGDWGQLPRLPQDYVEQRIHAHWLAFGVVSEARRLSAGAKIGLRWVAGGFGTPFYGDDEQVRVVGGELIYQRGSNQQSQAITTLAAAGKFLGLVPSETQREHDSPPLGSLSEELLVSEQANSFLGAWFGCATAALEELRAQTAGGDLSRVQLWPGHFDVAVELGEGSAKATYGASPGDGAQSQQPYLYVSPWDPDILGSPMAQGSPTAQGSPDGKSTPQGADFWNAESFVGAVLEFERLSDSSSPYHTALEFFRSARDRLGA